MGLKVNFLPKDPRENELSCDHRDGFRERRAAERQVLLTGNHDSLWLRRGEYRMVTGMSDDRGFIVSSEGEGLPCEKRAFWEGR